MIALGCDHGGYELKQEVIAYLEKNHLEYKDYGCYSTESTDYPIYAKLVGLNHVRKFLRYYPKPTDSGF